MIVFEKEKDVEAAMRLTGEILDEFSANGFQDLSLAMRTRSREDVLAVLPFLTEGTRLRFGGPLRIEEAERVWELVGSRGELLGDWRRAHVIDDESWDVHLSSHRLLPHELAPLIGPREPYSGEFVPPDHLPDRTSLAGCHSVSLDGKREPGWDHVRSILLGGLAEARQRESVELIPSASPSDEFEARGTVESAADVRALDEVVDVAARVRTIRLDFRAELGEDELAAGLDREIEPWLAEEAAPSCPLGFELAMAGTLRAEPNLRAEGVPALVKLLRERRIPAELTCRPLAWRTPGLPGPYTYWGSFLQLRSLVQGLKLELDFQCAWADEKPALNEVRRLFRRRFPTVSKRRKRPR